MERIDIIEFIVIAFVVVISNRIEPIVKRHIHNALLQWLVIFIVVLIPGLAAMYLLRLMFL